MAWLSDNAPSEDEKGEIEDKFYSYITGLVKNIETRKEVILLGDLINLNAIAIFEFQRKIRRTDR